MPWGAILYELLTGRPPFQAPDVVDVLLQVVADDPVPPGRLQPKLSRDLETICLKCLQKDPTRRYATAKDLGDDLQRYLEGRPIQARPVSRLTRAWRWCKRNPREAALAAMALVLVVVGLGAAWWLERRRHADDHAIELAINQTRLSWEQARTNPLGDLGRYREACTAAHQTSELARRGVASERMRQQAEQLLAEVEADAEAAEKDRRLLARLLEVRGPQEWLVQRRDETGLLVSASESDPDTEFAEAFRTYGLDFDRMSPSEVVARIRARPETVQVELIAALDEWASIRRIKRRPDSEQLPLMEIANILDTHKGRQQLRALLAGSPLDREMRVGKIVRAIIPLAPASNPGPQMLAVVTVAMGALPTESQSQLRELARDPETEAGPVLGVILLSRALRAVEDDKEAERLLRAALYSRPGEVVLLHTLGHLLVAQRPPRWPEALECYTAARAVRPELGVSLIEPLVRLNRQAEALALANEQLLHQPDNAGYHLALGFVLANQKKFVEAEPAFRKAIQFQPASALAWSNLGVILKEKGKPVEAEAAYRKAIQFQPTSALAWSNLGVILNEQKRPMEAEAAYRKANEHQPNFAPIWYNFGVLLADQKRPAEAEAAFRKAVLLQPNYALAWNNLGLLLASQKKLPEAEAAFRKAIEHQPENARAWSNLGLLLNEQKRPMEAEEVNRKAILLQPEDAKVWFNFGVHLESQKKPVEAEEAYRMAIQLQPDFAAAWSNLGVILNEQKRPMEAEAAYRKAIEHQPNLAMAWSNLGSLLVQKKPAEAEEAFRKAIESQRNYAPAWVGLGLILAAQKKSAEAEAAFRKAIEHQPDLAPAWASLGLLLKEQKKPVEAEAAYRKAIEHQPNLAMAWSNLGSLLADQKRPMEAEEAFRKAILLQPNDARIWHNLGVLLKDQQKKPVEAEDAFRKAIDYQPNFALAHCILGFALRDQGRFVEAVVSLKKGHDLGSRNPPWPYPSSQWVRDTERLIELDTKLPSILKGVTKPTDAAEQIELARLCQQYKKFHVASARFYGEAFASQLKLADDLRTVNRFNAACSAALAGCGQGKDADQTDEKERPRLREQAMTWLRADLAAWSDLLKNNPEKVTALVQQKMEQWKTNPDLACVRDSDALAKLPEDERKQWRQLWDDVETLRKHAAPK